MEGEPGPEEATLFPTTVGEKLRGAREAQGLDLAEVASRTRIPQRHLEAIERSNYSSLPSITYALGFAKAYARAVGADEVAIGRELRGELDVNYERVAPPPAYQMEDPTRTPSRGIAWIGLIVALLVIVGGAIWYGTTMFRGSPPPPETLEIPQETPTPTATPTTGGQVSLVALGTVWLSVVDAGADGKILIQREMQAGERFDLPADAIRPVAKTGRPDQIQVVVNGSNMPPLGPGNRSVEVEVSAEALLARGATPTPSPIAAPAPRRQAPAPAARVTPAPAPTRLPGEIVQPTNTIAP
jgi:cytoskeleton protein RodZ